MFSGQNVSDLARNDQLLSTNDRGMPYDHKTHRVIETWSFLSHSDLDIGHGQA